MPTFDRRTFLAAGSFALTTLALPALAAYPDKPIRLVVPYGGGGMGTAFGSMVTEVLGAQLKTPSYAEYKPGANAALGTEYVARAPADGYTLLMVTVSSVAINPYLYANLRYDPIKDLTPVAIVWVSRNVLFARAEIKTFQQLVDLGKKKPLTYGSLGVGTLAHLSAEMLLRETGIQAVHVPFKGQGQIMTEVAGGRLDFAFTDPAGVEFAKSGHASVLAVTGKSRLPTAPEVPTMAELGYPNIGTESWIAVMAPAGTPHDVVERLSKALAAGFADPAAKAKVAATGAEVAGNMSPEYFDHELRAEMSRWKKFLQESKIKIDQ